MIIFGYKSWINIKEIKYRYVFLSIILALAGTIAVYYGNYDYVDNDKLIATFQWLFYM